MFAIIGAWLVYQVQNKEAIPKDVLETMFQRAVLVTVLSFILSFFGPIDNWLVIFCYKLTLFNWVILEILGMK